MTAARWTLRPSTDGACLALRVDGDPRWRYVWFDPAFVACEHVRREAPDGDPCQAALPPPRLARAMFEGVTGGALHPAPLPVDEQVWALDCAAAHTEDEALLGAFAAAMTAPSTPTTGGGIDLAMVDAAKRERLGRALASRPALERGLVAALRRPRVAWTFAGSNAARASAYGSTEALQRALAPLLAVEQREAPLLEDGNFRAAVAVALGRVAATRRGAPSPVVRAMVDGLAETTPDATPALYLLWGLAALDDREARGAIARLAAQATTTAPWPATFDAFEGLIGRTPAAQRQALAARLARALR